MKPATTKIIAIILAALIALSAFSAGIYAIVIGMR